MPRATPPPTAFRRPQVSAPPRERRRKNAPRQNPPSRSLLLRCGSTAENATSRRETPLKPPAPPATRCVAFHCHSHFSHPVNAIPYTLYNVPTRRQAPPLSTPRTEDAPQAAAHASPSSQGSRTSSMNRSQYFALPSLINCLKSGCSANLLWNRALLAAWSSLRSSS